MIGGQSVDVEMEGKPLNREQLDFIYTGSAPFPESDKSRLCALLPTTRLFNVYGGSEVGSVCNYNYNVPDAKPGCIGRPSDDQYRFPAACRCRCSADL